MERNEVSNQRLRNEASSSLPVTHRIGRTVILLLAVGFLCMLFLPMAKITAYADDLEFSYWKYVENTDGTVKITGLSESGLAAIPIRDPQMPDTINGKTVTIIGNGAFRVSDRDYNNGVRYFTGSLYLPRNLKTIEEKAFYHSTELTGDLRIPNSVTEIGKQMKIWEP